MVVRSGQVRRGDRRGRQPTPAMMVCFFSCTICLLSIAHEVGNRVGLRMAYGEARVEREKLHVVRDKKGIVVSNGDVLASGPAVVARVIMVGGWLASSFVVLPAVFLLLPGGTEPAAGGGVGGVLVLPVVIGLFFAIPFRPIGQSVLITVVAVGVAIGCAWGRRALVGERGRG